MSLDTFSEGSVSPDLRAMAPNQKQSMAPNQKQSMAPNHKQSMAPNQKQSITKLLLLLFISRIFLCKTKLFVQSTESES